ncbi:CAP domain-containing protein [Streptococcus sp. 343_SSPC]|uniref:CAP domain-containing protein n=1 Tax=Streptococcus sp. 343_SSPC TaxID=1579342 RepID=UPI000660657E|nr:CAP domain-containing protein [Streptococcus sp. 343_SSPC]
MSKKLGKSVFTTGVAATTLFSALAGHKAQAEEIAQKNAGDQPSPDVTEMDSSFMDMNILNEQLLKAEKRVEDQRLQLNQAQSEYNVAKSGLEAAEANLQNTETRIQNSNQSTIGKTENEVAVAKAVVTLEEDKVRQATEADRQVRSAIKNQENKIAAQQLLVDIARNELRKAKQPIQNDETVLANAQQKEEQAQNELKIAQALVVNLTETHANVPQVLKQVSSEIAGAQEKIERLAHQISLKEVELEQVREAAMLSPINLQQASYEILLQEWAKAGDHDAVEALSLYSRRSEEEQLAGGKVTRLDNVLKALEIVDTINQYRRQAGLEELLVDPYQLPASQLQTEYYVNHRKGLSSYQENENVAWGYRPREAVAFWYSEKDHYRQLAKQFNLPTDESQLNPSQISRKVGPELFAKVGHYIHMMGNQYKAISVAYAPDLEVSQAAFFEEGGPLYTSEELTKWMRKVANARTTKADVKAVKNTLERLKVEKINQESRINILSGHLFDVKNSLASHEQLLARAQRNLASAMKKWQAASIEVKEAENSLAVSRARIQGSISPKEEALKNVALALEEDKKQLEALQNVAKETASKLEGAHAQLQIAQKQLTQAKGHLKLFTNSSELLVDAQALVASAKTELEEKKVEFETAFASFMAYQKEASEFRSRIEKIQSNEDGNQPVVAGGEEVTDQAQVSLLASTKSEYHLQDEANLEKATGKDEHKSKKGLSKWFRGLGFKKDE